MGLVDAIKGVFSFLGSRSRNEERMAEYLVREHQRGRAVSEILADHYVTNRCTPEQVKRLLDRPEVLHHLGEDVAARAKSEL
jgi:hypothetical protein